MGELTTSALKNFTFGAKMSLKTDKLPNLGLRFATGNIFFAVVATSNLQNLKAHKMLKVNDDLKLAATVEKSLKDKGPPKFSAGLLFNLAAFDTKLKAKAAREGLYTPCRRQVQPCQEDPQFRPTSEPRVI